MARSCLGANLPLQTVLLELRQKCDPLRRVGRKGMRPDSAAWLTMPMAGRLRWAECR